MTPTIWRFIRKLTKERGMTVVQLSEASGVTYGLIISASREESVRNSIHMEDLFDLADALRIRPDELIRMYAEAVGRYTYDE